MEIALNSLIRQPSADPGRSNPTRRERGDQSDYAGLYPACPGPIQSRVMQARHPIRWIRGPLIDNSQVGRGRSGAHDVFANRVERDVWATGGSTTVVRFAVEQGRIWADLD